MQQDAAQQDEPAPQQVPPQHEEPGPQQVSPQQISAGPQHVAPQQAAAALEQQFPAQQVPLQQLPPQQLSPMAQQLEPQDRELQLGSLADEAPSPETARGDGMGASRGGQPTMSRIAAMIDARTGSLLAGSTINVASQSTRPECLRRAGDWRSGRTYSSTVSTPRRSRRRWRYCCHQSAARACAWPPRRLSGGSPPG